jgi:hypothetical protein
MWSHLQHSTPHTIAKDGQTMKHVLHEIYTEKATSIEATIPKNYAVHR